MAAAILIVSLRSVRVLAGFADALVTCHTAIRADLKARTDRAFTGAATGVLRHGL